MTAVATSLAELREQLAQALLADPARGAKRERGLVTFLCPVHEESTASAFLGEYAWGCKGCSAGGKLLDLSDALGLGLTLASSGRGYTLEDYAREKGLPLDALERWGLTTEESRGSQVVMVPYYDAAGAPMRRRMRTVKRQGKADKYWEGQGGSIPGAYGLWMVAKKAGVVVLVEGESDSHALWSVGLLGVGLPGAETWRHCREGLLPLLAGRDVYVWQEPGPAGAQMVRDIAADLPQAKVLDAEELGAKDPCALRQQDPGAFRQRMLNAMADARRIGTPKPPIVFDALLGPMLDRIGSEKQGELDVVPTCFPAWDLCCQDEGGEVGLAYGWHVVIGGSTNSRKSLVALNLVGAAVHAGHRAAWVSLEMAQPQNATRALGVIAGEPVREMQHGPRFRPETWARATEHVEMIYAERGGLLYTNREYISSLEDIKSSVLYLWEYLGCRMAVIDYLQLAWVRHARDMQDQIIEVSHTVRGLAHQHKLLTIGISQITREASNAATTPRPTNLIGGSAVENDCDQVLMQDHTRERKVMGTVLLGGEPVETDTFCRESVSVMGKNRHGPKNIEIPTYFDASTLRIIQRKVPGGQEW